MPVAWKNAYYGDGFCDNYEGGGDYEGGAAKRFTNLKQSVKKKKLMSLSRNGKKSSDVKRVPTVVELKLHAKKMGLKGFSYAKNKKELMRFIQSGGKHF